MLNEHWPNTAQTRPPGHELHRGLAIARLVKPAEYPSNSGRLPESKWLFAGSVAELRSFDLSLSRWEDPPAAAAADPSTPVPRILLGLAAAGPEDRLFVFGGFDSPAGSKKLVKGWSNSG
jgi:hypothetical protein